MIELTESQFQAVIALLPVSDGYVEPRAILEGNNPGWVFANSATTPEVALIWSQGNDGFYLLGRQVTPYAEELNAFIDTHLRPRLLSRDNTFIEISSVPPVSDDALQSVFKSRSLISWTQSVYAYKSKVLLPTPSLPEGQLCNVKDIIGKHSIKNPTFVHDMILDNWHSIESFLANGNGYCVLIQDMVASLAFTGWIAGNTHEISIETGEKHRRKGFAKTCATALINHYLSKGHTPHWECEATNLASAKLAETLGFSKLHDYTCYGFSILH